MLRSEREQERQALHEQKSRLKKKLPAFLFCVSSVDPSERALFGKPRKGLWRKAAYLHLNGLFMADIDGTSPETFVRNVCFPGSSADSEYIAGHAPAYIASWCQREGILLMHITPSGRGLRLVGKAKLELNLIDNAAALCSRYGYRADPSCKDAARLSFAVPEKNILYIDHELFSFCNPAYDERWGAAYRKGQTQSSQKAQAVHSAPTATNPHPAQTATTPQEPITIEKNGKGEYTYKGIPYCQICDKLLDTLGGAPAVGERNTRYYDLVRRYLRYICDFNEDFILRVAPSFGLTEGERRETISSALSTRRYAYPRKLREIVEDLLEGSEGKGGNKGVERIKEQKDADYRTFSPFLDGPWKPVCSSLDDGIKLAGMLAAGAMFGTYLSPVNLRNFYDGNDWRLSFMVYIIGPAASGKGQFNKLNQLIMTPMRLTDSKYRAEEDAVKAMRFKRETSRKEQQKAGLDLPCNPIRLLPGTISNAMRYKRMRDAKLTWCGVTIQLHCYIFESELAAKLRSEQGSWAGAQDLDCKSFSNEYGGNDYANAQATNGPIQVNMNQVITGTQDALNRKITLNNCLDGLATRLVMFQMPTTEFCMLNRSIARRTEQENIWLSQIGYTLEKFRGDFDLSRQVKVPREYQDVYGATTSFADALYLWGATEAERCREEQDRCADYFRRRVPIIATRYGVVDAILRWVMKEKPQTDTIDADKVQYGFESIHLACLLASYLQDAQIQFFGSLVTQAEQEATREVTATKKTSKADMVFATLPATFTIEDVQKQYPNQITARVRVAEWKQKAWLTTEVKNRKHIYKKTSAKE